ncbi:MAG TPA: carboxypeptidase regulatory-like domain-containing protein [Lapillicoccus sp.]|nr:carboxypeptidase regulatory-like domain-containing protein [Lapillicoccus sp.]
MTDDQSHLEALEAMPIDAEDGRALATLRRIYEVGDPVPPSLLERVKFAITLDDLEAEVARLQREAVTDLAAARSEDVLKAQTVTFTSETLTTMVTITPHASGGVRIDGWASPGAGLGVELRVGDTTLHATADEDGRFVFEEVANGLAQFVLRPSGEGGGNPVVTPAIEL